MTSTTSPNESRRGRASDRSLRSINIGCARPGSARAAAAVGRRLASRRQLLWSGLALAGFYLLGSGGFDQFDVAGVAFALGAGRMWAAYIVLNARAGARFPRLDGLTIAMSVAALVSLPLGVGASGGRLLEPEVFGLGLAIAVMTSGVPCALELLALRRLPATFAVLTSLSPAIVATAGYLVLDQDYRCCNAPRSRWWSRRARARCARASAELKPYHSPGATTTGSISAHRSPEKSLGAPISSGSPGSRRRTAFRVRMGGIVAAVAGSVALVGQWG